MEMEGYRTCPTNTDVARELRIGSHDPAPHGAGDGGVEVSNLPAGMNARIGTARAGHGDVCDFSRVRGVTGILFVHERHAVVEVERVNDVGFAVDEDRFPLDA